MFDKLKFVIVEDTDADRREVLNLLSDAGFEPENNLGAPSRYDEALDLITARAADIDIVFLDLRIPRDVGDTQPEKRVGGDLLDLIHDEFNRRRGHDIRVVIVSGEHLLDGFSDVHLSKSYPGTLVSIAEKGSLVTTLKRALTRLRRDPTVQALRRVGLESLIEKYQVVKDADQPIRERLGAARELAFHLVRNEHDHYTGRIDDSARFGDDLHGLLRGIESDRFRNPETTKPARAQQSMITADGGWGAFLWRGALLNHLKSINGYRNVIVHLKDQPYLASDGSSETWTIPAHVLKDLETGRWLGQMACAMVDELLAMYLPWHEQVFVPWRKSVS